MNDPVFQELRELSWRRELTPAEEARLQAWLAARPDAKPDWEAESRLSRLLTELSPPAVSSNFTSLVFQAVEREGVARDPQGRMRLWSLLRLWMLRGAVASMVVGLVVGIVAHHQHVERDRAAMARSVTEMFPVVEASNPEVIENLDSIAWMGDLRPKGDTELLTLME